MRPQDLYPFQRNERALILRIGTIAASTTSTLDVDVPGGRLTGIPMLTAVTVVTNGTKVAVVLDRDSALVIGNVK